MKKEKLTQEPHRLLLGDVDVEVSVATQQTGRRQKHKHVSPHRPAHRPVTGDTWTGPSSALDSSGVHFSEVLG